jgi:hypothetical protein
MPLVSVFYQQCPVCGRSLRIPVQYFGHTVACQHCRGEFVADNHATHSQNGSAPVAIVPPEAAAVSQCVEAS